MTPEAVAIGAIVVISLGLLLYLPAKKHWNAGGEADRARDEEE
ncbi:MAG: hypothetical protein ACPHID_03405 [Thermoplasmatota archaeon]